MIKIVVSNQRGGVGKTTTAATLARCFAELGKRVLLIDTDSQGSVSAVLGLKPEYTLYDFLITQIAFKMCVVPAHPRIDVLCSDRRTMEAEDVITSRMGREMAFEQAFIPHEQEYDTVLIDVAPSLTLFQMLLPIVRNPLCEFFPRQIRAYGSAALTARSQFMPDLTCLDDYG